MVPKETGFVSSAESMEKRSERGMGKSFRRAIQGALIVPFCFDLSLDIGQHITMSHELNQHWDTL